MSVVLVCLPGAPKISEEAVKKEEELDKYLETRVEGQFFQHALKFRNVDVKSQMCVIYYYIASQRKLASLYSVFSYRACEKLWGGRSP